MPETAPVIADDTESTIIIDGETPKVTDTSETPQLQEEKKEETPEEREKKLQNKVAESQFEKRQAKRENKELADRLAALEASQNADAGQRPEVSAPPDQFSDNFEQEQATRDGQIAEAAAFDARQTAQQEQEQRNLQTANAERDKALNEASTENAKRGIQLGIPEEDLNRANDRLVQYPFTVDELAFILTDEQGPLISKYLTDNPAEIESFVNMPAGINRGAFLAGEIKSKAAATKVKTTETPDPVETLSGLGATKKERGPDGATYE
jgi:hypothetical protein